MKKLLLFACALFGFMACTQNPIEEQSAIRTDVPETIRVGFEDDETRIQLNEAQKTVWTKDDLVSVFYRSDANQKWQYQGETGERVGDLKCVDADTATESMKRVVVVYPYNENYYINTETYNVQATLPATQHYLANSYGTDGNIMVSSSEYNQFSLKSVCGWLKLQLTGDGEVVKSIKFRGNDDEQVAGELYINSADATAMLASDMGGTDDNNAGGNLVFDDTILTEVVLDCGEGATLGKSATAFYIALPPQTFANGFTVEIECDGYELMTLTTEKELVIERNHIQPMASVEHNAEQIIPNNEIWYTNGSTTEATTPNRTNAFGANIVSNTYDTAKECWVIKFDGEVTTIGEYAFYYCSSLTSITIPDCVTEIGNYAFERCTSLISVNIPDIVTTIGYYAFYHCANLTSVNIPDSVTTIGDAAFEGCDSLTEFTGKFAEDNGRILVVDGVLTAFAPAGITEYNIPDSVTEIGDSAFSDCSSLTSVNIPDSVTTIGDGAFYNCYSLTSVNIPDSVTTIGYRAFDLCDSLTSVNIGDSVTTIGWSAFGRCTSLTSVYCKATTPPAGDSSMFSYNASGRKIYVPIVSIEVYKNAAGWKNYANDIVGYDFEQNTNESNSCTITGSHASFTMSDSGSLYSLAKKVIDNVNTTEEWGEEIWSNITSITINGMMDARDFSTLKWNFRNLEILDISNVVVTGYTGDKGTVEGYEYYYDDNTIPLGAFFYWMSHILRPFPQELSDEGMSSLVQIKLPDGIKTIQRNAFARAYNLIDINIPDSVETIGWVSFSICTSLEHITIPENVLEIEDWAFKGCSSLNSVYCKAIYPPICGSCVFDDNASNRKIYVPNESVELYKNAEGWRDYADDILGYDTDIDQDISLKTIVVNSAQQPIYAGGHIDGYNNANILKKGVIVSKFNEIIELDENTFFEMSPLKYIEGIDDVSCINRHFKIPQDLSVYDCSNINKEQYITPLICLEGNTKYYIRAYAITEDNDYIYGDIIEIDTMPYGRCYDDIVYSNIWHWADYTLFDLVTDEIINIDEGFYYSTNENPELVRYQKGYSYNTCYKFATEWNYKLWYYHNIFHCDSEKIVDIPIMSVTGDVLSISKSQNDIDKDITIFYKVNGDGSRPENFSSIYSEPINVNSGDRVYCYAISGDGYMSYTNLYIVQ